MDEVEWHWIGEVRFWPGQDCGREMIVPEHNLVSMVAAKMRSASLSTEGPRRRLKTETPSLITSCLTDPEHQTNRSD